MGDRQRLLGDAYIPKYALAVVLCATGDRQRLLDDAYIPKRAQTSRDRMPPRLVGTVLSTLHGLQFLPRSPIFATISKFRHGLQFSPQFSNFCHGSPIFTMFSKFCHGIVLSTLQILPRSSAKHSPCSPISPRLSAKHSPMIFMFSSILHAL